MGDAQSMLILHRRLLALRRTSDALAIGDFALADAEGDILAYERRHGDARVFVALNLGSDAQRASFTGWAARGRVLLSTLPDHRSEERRVGKEWVSPFRFRWAPYQ